MEQRMRKLKKANKSKVNNEHLQCVCVRQSCKDIHVYIYMWENKSLV